MSSLEPLDPETIEGFRSSFLHNADHSNERARINALINKVNSMSGGESGGLLGALSDQYNTYRGRRPHPIPIQDDFGLDLSFSGAKWGGFVLAPNGLIIGIPYDYDKALIIDPTTNNAWLEDFGGPSEVDLSGTAKWFGGGVGGDGHIWCVPDQTNGILRIDPNTMTAVKDTFGATIPSGGFKWVGGIMGSDQKLYCIPETRQDILVIDTLNQTATNETFGLSFTPTIQWWGGVRSIDGRIFCCPVNVNNVLIINPEDNSATVENFGLDLSSWSGGGGVLAPDGKIWMTPLSTDLSFLVIDPISNTASFESILVLDSENNEYTEPVLINSGVLGGDGNVYYAAGDFLPAVWYLNLETKTMRFLVFDDETEAQLFLNGVLLTDGRIYLCPREAEYVGVIRPSAPGFPAWVTHSPFLNKGF